MDVPQLVQTVLEIMQAPISHMKEHKKQSFELKSELEWIKDDLEMIKGDMESYEELQVQELAYDIEDFVQGILAPWAAASLYTVMGMHPIDEHLYKAKSFSKRIEKLKRRQQRSVQSGSSGGAGDTYSTQDRYPEGIDKRKSELLELLSPSPVAGQHAEYVCQLRVISIVGPRGVGKTTLARAVYEDLRISGPFDCIAWIVASGCNDPGELLTRIVAGAGGTTSADLHGILAQKRYLVFIDDVQGAELWKYTVDSFPKNDNSSRIIVTTSIRSVATACSSGSYVYLMQCLGEDESRYLFWKNVFGREREHVPSLVNGSDRIFSKCDGLPLALISAAKSLSTKGHNLKKNDCEELGRTLGSSYLARNATAISFGDMRRRLAQCYDSLPDYAHKTCLLSLSTFPLGHQINCKRLVRRVVAEGLGAEVGHKCFRELIDRSIIEPILVDDNSKVVLRFKVHGIILEFTIQESVSKNFVTLIHEGDPIRKEDGSVRRLAVQSSPINRFGDVENTSALRSLIMFNSEPTDFKSFKMLRILDLEGCQGIDKRILEGICELLLLKYLSVRKTNVDNIPTEIQKLQCLETLDIRETGVAKLPVEVIMLPKLAYLFGKFELLDMDRETNKLYEFLRERSELHTLAGVLVAQGSHGFEQVILKARKLKKVKVWSNDTTTSSPAPANTLSTLKRKLNGLVPSNTLSTVKRKFCRLQPPDHNLPTPHMPPPDHNPPTPHTPPQGTRTGLLSSLQKKFTALDSVSIDSNELCKEFMDSLRCPCITSSIKIRGKLNGLPDSATLSGLLNLTKLQLFSTGLNSQKLSILQNIACLEFLKLVEHRDGFWKDNFVVGNGGFHSLRELWFEAPELPKLQFEQGALVCLTSLHLFCLDSSQMQVTARIEGGDVGIEGISHLTDLNEVILHHSATETEMRAWKSLANMHSNRPSIRRQPIKTNQK